MPDTRFNTGLVIGKFYPPHLGHSYLIDVACAQARHVTVIVCDHVEQTISGHLRAAWLRELHPDVEVLRINDVYPPDDSQLWARLTVGWLGYAPDAVFSSEAYGEPYARLMGSTHIAVDRDRTAVPCSGTQIRADPFAWWDFLAPCVRGYFAARVVLIGAESTGKTTLAQALAAHYRTTWVPEYGRTYWETKACGPQSTDAGQWVPPVEGGVGQVAPVDSWAGVALQKPPPVAWRSEEFVHIAREQCRREDAAARTANRVLICDTDAFATAIWHERYLHTASPLIDAMVETRHPRLYLLTGIDIPFVQDGTRDGERIRPWMHERFLQALQARHLPYILLRGSPEARLRAASEAIDALVAYTFHDVVRHILPTA